MSGNHEVLEGGGGEEVLVQYVLEEDIIEEEEGDDDVAIEQDLRDTEEPGNDEQEEDNDDDVDEDSQTNQEVVIFKSEGMEANTMITYSIPMSNTDEYEEEEEGDSGSRDVLVTDDQNALQHPYLTYQIIDGYLVPTSSIAHSEKPAATITPIPVHPQEDITIIPCPIKPADLTPDALRKKSRQNPEKLLIIYHCSFCPSAFEDFQSVKIHESEHRIVGDPVLMNLNPQTNYFGAKLVPTTNDSKFNCPSCFVGFSMSAHLRKHIWKMHKEEAREMKIRRKCAAIKTEVVEGDDAGENLEASHRFMVAVGAGDDGETTLTYDGVGP